MRTRREFWTLHPLAEIPLRGWSAEASKAVWWTPADIKTAHRRASFLANNRVVFNIKGNDYRLVVALTVSVPTEPTAAMHELARAIAPVSGSGIGVGIGVRSRLVASTGHGHHGPSYFPIFI
jgi:mRNA-degrading endonuclease HigB of HigAB toxin-antitoxin module